MRSKLTAVLAVAAIFVVVTGAALASHYEYLADDPFKQKSVFPRTENYAAEKWALTQTGDITWWAEPEIHDEVSTAIWHWSAAEQTLDWVEVFDDTNADVVFWWVPEVCTACVEWRDFYEDPVSDASYWRAIDVLVNSNINWGPGGRQAAIAHEIGHLYGLHERYINCTDPDNPDCTSNGEDDCNGNEKTIIDTGKRNADDELVHCDGSLVGPVEDPDVLREQAFWHTGTTSSFTATQTSPTAATYTYKDDSWAEDFHRQIWWYWDESVSNWRPYHWIDEYRNGVGVLLAASLACGPAAQSAGGQPAATSPPVPTIAPTPTPTPTLAPPTPTPTPTPTPDPLLPGLVPPDPSQLTIPTAIPSCLTPRGRVPKNAEDNQRAREHAQKEGINCVVLSMRPEGVITVKDVKVQLPPDVFIVRWTDHTWCVEGEPCPETPYVELQRGESKIWVSTPSGTIFKEKIAPWEEGAFDFLREALK